MTLKLYLEKYNKSVADMIVCNIHERENYMSLDSVLKIFEDFLSIEVDDTGYFDKFGVIICEKKS